MWSNIIGKNDTEETVENLIILFYGNPLINWLEVNKCHISKTLFLV